MILKYCFLVCGMNIYCQNFVSQRTKPFEVYFCLLLLPCLPSAFDLIVKNPLPILRNVHSSVFLILHILLWDLDKIILSSLFKCVMKEGFTWHHLLKFLFLLNGLSFHFSKPHYVLNNSGDSVWILALACQSLWRWAGCSDGDWGESAGQFGGSDNKTGSSSPYKRAFFCSFGFLLIYFISILCFF